MNSPPDSVQFFEEDNSLPPTTKTSPHIPRHHNNLKGTFTATVLPQPPADQVFNGEPDLSCNMGDVREVASPHRAGPPSPSSLGSIMAVGSLRDAAIIQSIERGEYAADDDGDYDDTRSLTDSIRQHIVDGGLRYHAYHAGQYAFPNDETEQYRDEMKHSVSVYLCDGDYFLAPVHEMLDEGAEVLDLGRSLVLSAMIYIRILIIR